MKEIFKFICSKEDIESESEREQVSVCVLFFLIFLKMKGELFTYTSIQG